MVAQPHYLLFCDTHHCDNQFRDSSLGGCAGGSGRWHFVLERLDGPERLEAADSETSVNRERLALLSVVRGLEALEQPSQVTLVTTSRYVDRGLRYGLGNWREADYMWERFGEQRPVRNSDLWRRVDTAMQFHGVKCRLIQAGQSAVAPLAAPLAASGAAGSHTVNIGTLNTARPKTDWAPALQNLPLASPAASMGRPWEQPNQPNRNVPSVAKSARYLPGNEGVRHASTLRGWPDCFSVHWWSLAAAWIRWWRGRMQAKPAFYAT
jgi:ribonuclease HI